MANPSERKIVWSFKVHRELREWFDAYAGIKGLDSQDVVRTILADFREDNKHQILDRGYTGWLNSPLASS
jgi:hypothetical protein